jgi:DNA replication protein DnaC
MMQLRVVKPTDRPAQPSEDGLERLSAIMRIPEWMFQWPGHANISAAAVTYECPVHGIITPLAFANGYRRRECPCQWERRQAESVERYQDAIQRSLGTKQAERCYTWLGKDAEEVGLETKTFGNFDHDYQTDAFKFCINYNPLEDPKNLILIGTVGTGKTHLAAAICNALRAQDIPCLFATAQNLFNAYYTANFDRKLSIEEQFGSTKLMVLDDIGNLNLNEATGGKFQRKTLFALLNRRYIRKLPTVITTNEPDAMEQCFNEATLDRLYERCQILPMNGKSYRKVLAEQHKGE